MLPPILIYQMARVGSKTVVESLRRVMPQEQALHHVHQLHDVDRTERELARVGAVSEAHLDYLRRQSALRRRFDAGEPTRWNVITLVRDPVARNLSAFFFGLAHDAPHFYESVRRGRVGHEVLLSRFMKDFGHSYALNWFDLQFRPVFGLDVFARPFPREQGYQILEMDRGRALVLRTEDLDRSLRPAIDAFLGWPGCVLVRANVGARSRYASAYGNFLDRVVIPEGYLDEMYDHRLVRHFYAPEEIEGFRQHWRKKGAAAR